MKIEKKETEILSFPIWMNPNNEMDMIEKMMTEKIG